MEAAALLRDYGKYPCCIINKAKLGKATAGEKSLRANTKLQKLQSKSTNVSPPPQEKKKKKLPRSVANCRSYAGSKNGLSFNFRVPLTK